MKSQTERVSRLAMPLPRNPWSKPPTACRSWWPVRTLPWPAARALISSEGCTVAELALSLVVIRAANLEQARQFYAALGLSFVKEQHGRSPEHYAATIGPTVFEIYPREPNSSDSATAPRFSGALAGCRVGHPG